MIGWKEQADADGCPEESDGLEMFDPGHPFLTRVIATKLSTEKRHLECLRSDGSVGVPYQEGYVQAMEDVLDIIQDQGIIP